MVVHFFRNKLLGDVPAATTSVNLMSSEGATRVLDEQVDFVKGEPPAVNPFAGLGGASIHFGLTAHRNPLVHFVFWRLAYVNLLVVGKRTNEARIVKHNIDQVPTKNKTSLWWLKLATKSRR